MYFFFSYLQSGQKRLCLQAFETLMISLNHVDHKFKLSHFIEYSKIQEDMPVNQKFKPDLLLE